MLDKLVKGGQVVAGGTVITASIGIKGERISVIADPSERLEASETIDATGKIVMPGAIDAHVHFLVFKLGGAHMVEEMGDTSVSGAYGGITTFIPFIGGPPEMSAKEVINHFLGEGKNSILDFAFHYRPQRHSRPAQDVAEATELGVNSFKMLFAYRARGLMWEDHEILSFMEEAGRKGGIAMFHCENGAIIDYYEERCVAQGKVGPKYFLATRPNLAEAESVARVIYLSQMSQCPIYIVHLSTREALQEVIRAHGDGKAVYAETCPQYTLLTDAQMQKYPLEAKVAPPLRRESDLEAMWWGIQKGFIEIVSSDHAPYNMEGKRTPQVTTARPSRFPGENIFEVPFGMPGIETLLPLMYSEGVAKNRISLPRLVQLVSENVAKRFGLYPRKGVIAVGSDADLVILDPAVEWALHASDLHSKSDYSCFEGWRIKGRPVLSMLRGRVLLKDGKIHLSPGDGQFLPRYS